MSRNRGMSSDELRRHVQQVNQALQKLITEVTRNDVGIARGLRKMTPGGEVARREELLKVPRHLYPTVEPKMLENMTDPYAYSYDRSLAPLKGDSPNLIQRANFILSLFGDQEEFYASAAALRMDHATATTVLERFLVHRIAGLMTWPAGKPAPVTVLPEQLENLHRLAQHPGLSVDLKRKCYAAISLTTPGFFTSGFSPVGLGSFEVKLLKNVLGSLGDDDAVNVFIKDIEAKIKP